MGRRSGATKTPKSAWFCRSCGKPQNRKAPPRPSPVCAGCGRLIETDHYIADVPVDDRGLAIEPSPPPSKSEPDSARRAPGQEANIAMRLLDHENRISRLEKSPSTVLADLERALSVMDAEQLSGLDAMLGRTLERLEAIRGQVRSPAIPR